MVVTQEKIEWQEPVKSVSQREKSQPNRRKRRTKYSKKMLILGLIVLATGSIGVETINLTVVKGAEIRTLEKNISDLKAKNDLLQVQVDQLSSVSRIEKAALAMGMEEPTGTVYVAGALPAVENQAGAPTTQVASLPPKEAKPSALKQFSQSFTSFFASTQR